MHAFDLPLCSLELCARNLTRTTATPNGGGDTEEKGGETALVKLEDQQTGSKGNSRVSMFPPEEDAKVEAPSRWRGGSAQHGSAADLFYSSIDRLKSPVYSTPEGSSERHEQMDSRGARGAERCPPDQPLKSHTSTRQDARETRQSKGQVSQTLQANGAKCRCKPFMSECLMVMMSRNMVSHLSPCSRSPSHNLPHVVLLAWKRTTALSLR